MLMRQRQPIKTFLFTLLILLLLLPASLCAESETDSSLLVDAMRVYAEGDYATALPQLLFLLESANEETPMIEARLAVARIYLQRERTTRR